MSTNNGWIKTKDKLPDLSVWGFSRNCLLWGREQECDHEETVFFGTLFKNGEWVGVNGKCFDVTHWQPLPEPPQD